MEVLLSISVVVILAGISAPVYQNLQVKNETDIAVSTIAQSLRRAQILSQAVDGDSTWGVKTQSESIVLFKGATYVTRDSTYDEIFVLSPTVIPTGLTEVVFSKLTGYPQQTGTTTLTNTANETKTVSINSKGTVDF